MSLHLLFLCSRNKLRSPTAEAIFSGRPGVEVDSAGLSDDAEVPVSLDQIEWADIILVMEKIHREKLNRRFGEALAGKRIRVLGIPDNYGYLDPALIRLLESKCRGFFS
ncbi:MAG: phosphotyrosine protein phosphatase [Verrucomicrobiae bacterium]|nr:phosphotyrosine protein phosphatase [Verrucomicrobiae bacterium]